ncbi:MAG: hypothetical protein ACRDRS_12250 [Pseudonocardiaceae bacterium]
MQVFPTATAARASLQAKLDNGVGSDPGSSCARPLRKRGRDGELMMWFMASTYGWIVFQVPDSLAPLDAAVATYEKWKRPAHAAFMDWMAELREDYLSTPGIWFP